MSESYYTNLPAIRINLRNKTSRVFERCEYNIGDSNYCVVFQWKTKTVIPLSEIDNIEYPYEGN